MIVNPTPEQVLSDCTPGWSVLSIGVTHEFRAIVKGTNFTRFRVEQLVVERHPETADGATAEWRVLASSTTAREAIETMEEMQLRYVKELRKRRAGRALLVPGG